MAKYRNGSVEMDRVASPRSVLRPAFEKLRLAERSLQSERLAARFRGNVPGGNFGRRTGDYQLRQCIMPMLRPERFASIPASPGAAGQSGVALRAVAFGSVSSASGGRLH